VLFVYLYAQFLLLLFFRDYFVAKPIGLEALVNSLLQAYKYKVSHQVQLNSTVSDSSSTIDSSASSASSTPGPDERSLDSIATSNALHF
jgi:hypothetical protein